MAMMGERPTEGFLHQDAEALFDIGADPAESRNRIDDPGLTEGAREMREKVQRFRVETKDPWVLASIQRGEVGLGSDWNVG